MNGSAHRAQRVGNAVDLGDRLSAVFCDQEGVGAVNEKRGRRLLRTHLRLRMGRLCIL